MKPAAVRWIRRSLVLVMLIVIAAVGTNYIQRWRKRVGIVRQAAELLSADMLRSADRLEYSEYNRGILRFKLRANKLLETKQGRSLLEGIEATDLNPDGSTRSRIFSNRAEYDREGQKAAFSGEVRVLTTGGMELRTESLNYDLRLNAGASEDRVEFKGPEGRGSATGVRYDHEQDTLELARDIRFVLQRKAPAGPEKAAETEEIQVESRQAYYARKDLFMRFWGGVLLTSQGGHLAGEELEARFNKDGQRLQSLLCAGDAAYATQADGSTRTLQGDRIHFLIHQEKGTLENIVVEGGARYDSEEQGAAQALSGEAIQMQMNAESGRPDRLYARNRVRFRSDRSSEQTRIESGSLEAEFNPERGSLRSLRVWEGTSMTTRKAGEEEGDMLAAEEIRMVFGSEAGKSTLTRLEADRSVRWQSSARKAAAGQKPASGRSLSSETLRMTYSPAGVPENAEVKGDVRVILLPAPKSAGTQLKELQADSALVGFQPPDGRLRSFEGKGRIRVTYQAEPRGKKGEKTSEIRTSSDEIQAAFAAEDGSLEKAAQWGNFQYQDGSRTASSSRSDFDGVANTIDLTGNPRLADPDSTTTGERMRFDRKKEMLLVEGRVRSVMSSGEGGNRTPFGARTGTRTPTVVTSERMEYDSRANHAAYSGGVQLLSENGQLEARHVDVYEGGERIEARENVRHLMRQTERAAANDEGSPNSGPGPARRPPPEPKNVSIRSANLRYLKAKETLEYDGAVQLDSQDVRISSKNLIAYLKPDTGEVDRALARGQLVIRQTGREIRGESCEYSPGPGRFVVTGNPAELMDQQRGKSTARRLTFQTSDDRVLLEHR